MKHGCSCWLWYLVWKNDWSNFWQSNSPAELLQIWHYLQMENLCDNWNRLLQVTCHLSHPTNVVEVLTHAHTHTYTTVLWPFSGTAQVSQCQKRNLLLDFMVQGKITEADTPTVRLGIAWSSSRASVFGRRALAVLRSTCSWWVTTYVGKPSAIGQPIRPTQPFILSGSINE